MRDVRQYAADALRAYASLQLFAPQPMPGSYCLTGEPRHPRSIPAADARVLLPHGRAAACEAPPPRRAAALPFASPPRHPAPHKGMFRGRLWLLMPRLTAAHNGGPLAMHAALGSGSQRGRPTRWAAGAGRLLLEVHFGFPHPEDADSIRRAYPWLESWDPGCPREQVPSILWAWQGCVPRLRGGGGVLGCGLDSV